MPVYTLVTFHFRYNRRYSCAAYNKYNKTNSYSENWNWHRFQHCPPFQVFSGPTSSWSVQRVLKETGKRAYRFQNVPNERVPVPSRPAIVFVSCRRRKRRLVRRGKYTGQLVVTRNSSSKVTRQNCFSPISSFGAVGSTLRSGGQNFCGQVGQYSGQIERSSETGGLPRVQKLTLQRFTGQSRVERWITITNTRASLHLGELATPRCLAQQY